MAQPTYSTTGIVLRKTKLGESDLIISLLTTNGAQIRAIAKGARKPTSSFASRIELFSEIDILAAKGRNLDIVKEVRLVDGHASLRFNMELSACAAPMVELLERASLEDLENSQIFPLSQKALSTLENSESAYAPSICAAHLLKALAFLGFKPNLVSCVACGLPIIDTSSQASIPFSVIDGGVMCNSCCSYAQFELYPASTLGWCKILLYSTFAEIKSLQIDPRVSFLVLRFLQTWIREHIGVNIKSLNFLFTCGLY